MASFGNGYGSECHLLRYLGRHRERLHTAICEATGATDVRWLDFPFVASWPDPKGGSRVKGGSRWPDVEWLSLDFLPRDSEVVRDWRERWPHGGGIMNWDAVGQVEVGGVWEWLLVEAKGHLSEIKSDCSASAAPSIERIERTLAETKAALGAPPNADWLRGYYQYANRLAVLHHLDRHDVGARLMFIYFCGDFRPDAFECPQDESGWADALAAQEAHLHLRKHHALAPRVHKLFLPVWEE